MSFRKWVLIIIILALLTGVCLADDSHGPPPYANCGWTDQQFHNCATNCALNIPQNEFDSCFDGCINCRNPSSSSNTETPGNCQAMYSSCIQNTCPGTQGTKTCYDSCQYQVEAQSGASCVLFPTKMVSTGNGNAGDISGDVQLTTANGQSSVQLKNGDVIPVGSKVTTNNGYAKITFADGTPITLVPHTTLSYLNEGYRLTAGTMKNFATCSLENLAPGSFACPPIFSPVARFSVSGGT